MPEQLPGDSDSLADPLARHALSAPELKQVLAAERAGDAFLAFRDAEGALCIFRAADRDGTTTLGRRSGMDVALAWDREISGLHAELHHLGGEWAIVDDGLSRNGTFVNGQRVAGRQRLRDGDRIRLGRTVLAYRGAQVTLAQETAFAEDRQAPALTDMQRQVLVALCRPYRDSQFATPATNQEIAAEVFLSVDAVKMHLRTLFAKFELGELAQNQKRARLVEVAFEVGAISRGELA
jgi:DNA-binding CsgD family transcriptional regulator